MSESPLNSGAVRVAAVLLIAAAVWALPSGGNVAAAVIELLGAAMLAAIAFTAWRFWREHQLEFDRLEVRGRLVLFGAIGLVVLAMAGRPVLWATVIGSVLWLLMVGLAVAGAVLSWRAWREL